MLDSLDEIVKVVKGIRIEPKMRTPMYSTNSTATTISRAPQAIVGIDEDNVVSMVENLAKFLMKER